MYKIQQYFSEIKYRLGYIGCSLSLTSLLFYAYFNHYMYLLIRYLFRPHRDFSIDSTYHHPIPTDLDFPHRSSIPSTQSTHSHLSSLEFQVPLIFKPLDESFSEFIFTDIAEAFSTSLWISFGFSLFFIFPLCCYHLWAFVLPSLYYHERRRLTQDFLFLFLVYLLAFFVWICFLFPVFWKFFLHFENSNEFFQLKCQPRISSYISFLFQTYLFSQILMSLPFCLFLLIKYQYLHIHTFINQRRLIYLLILFFVAFLSPPDVLTQIVFSFVTGFFFEIYLFFFLFLEIYHKEEKNSEC